MMHRAGTTSCMFRSRPAPTRCRSRLICSCRRVPCLSMLFRCRLREPVERCISPAACPKIKRSRLHSKGRSRDNNGATKAMTTAKQNPKLSNMYSRIERIRQESANLKQSVEKLRAGAELLGDPFGDMNICTYAMAPDGTIIAASLALVQLLGYESLDELRARNSDGGEYDSEYVQALFARHDGQINDIASVWRRKDGSIIHVRESARAIYDDLGRPIE